MQCEFVYDEEADRHRVLIRPHASYRHGMAYKLGMPTAESYRGHFEEMEAWVHQNCKAGTYTVYRPASQMLVISFRRMPDIIHFKIRWHG